MHGIFVFLMEVKCEELEKQDMELALSHITIDT